MRSIIFFFIISTFLACTTFKGVKSKEKINLREGMSFNITDKSTFLNSKPEGKSFLNFFNILSEGIDSDHIVFYDSIMELTYKYPLANKKSVSKIKGVFKDGYFEYQTGFKEKYFGGNKRVKSIIKIGLKKDFEIMVSEKTIKARGLFLFRSSGSLKKTYFFKSSKTKRKTINFG